MNGRLEENGYVVVRNFIDKEDVRTLQIYYDLLYNRVMSGFEPENYEKSKTTDSLTEIADSHSFYADNLVESLSLKYGQKICSITELDLSPTYTYSRIYSRNDKLLGHIDRPACEISITTPVFISGDRASSIFISKFKTKNLQDAKRYTKEEMLQMGEFSRIDLFPGDVLIYKGCEHYHWREDLESEILVQVFMHYVQTNGPHSNQIYDKRTFVGLPSPRTIKR